MNSVNNLALPGIRTGDSLREIKSNVSGSPIIWQFVQHPGNRKIMRILIQKKDTGLYFKDIQGWTANAAEAMDFLCSTTAIEFCTANKIKGVHLVLKFEEEHHEIVLPVVKDRAARSDEGRAV